MAGAEWQRAGGRESALEGDHLSHLRGDEVVLLAKEEAGGGGGGGGSLKGGVKG